MSNPTTPFGWQMPEPTDLVTDLPADFEVFGQAVATDLQYLLGGTTGQVLAKASATDLDFDWITDATGMTNPMTTTGDSIYSSSGSTPARLGIGTTGQVLTVASGLPSWATPASGSTLAGALVTKNTNQSLSNNSLTVLSFETEIFDTDAYHSTTVNNSRITIPAGKAGYYQISGVVEFTAGVATNYAAQLQLNGNSLNFPANGSSGGNFNNYVPVNLIYYCSVGDYLTLAARQITGGTISAIGGAIQNCYFSAYFVGA